MNVMVIGGSGIFGRKVVTHLVRDKAISKVVSMDVLPPAKWFNMSIEAYADKFRFISGDVSDLEAVLNAIKNYGIDRIVNMAFILAGAFENNPRLAIKVNALGMCNVFEAARLMGIARVVFARSVAVYGPQNEYGDRQVGEDEHLHPANGYGVTKQLSEILAAQYSELYDIQFSAVRPFLGYGHGGKFPPIIKEFSDLISLPATGRPFRTEMDGNNPSALSSAEDVGNLVGILIKASSSPHPVYNVASPPTTMRDIGTIVKKYLPDSLTEFGSRVMPRGAEKFALPRKVSMVRAREDLGFLLMPLEQVVLNHINDSRLEAGLEPIRRTN